MTRGGLSARLLVAGALAVGCFELSAPPSGLAAISPINLAWPSVVAGDVLRDEQTDVAPLVVDAYDGEGNLVDDVTVTFVVLDTGLRVDPDGTVHGLNARATPARVVAQVRRGADVLQTPELNIDVVPPPDSVTPTPGRDTTFADKPIPIADPAPISSEPLVVKVLSRGATAVPVKSWIVRYEITAEPAGANGQRTALFGSGGPETVSLDTTDASGVASRTIVLQRLRLASSTGRQEVRVRATIRGVGQNDPDRTLTFVLPFVGQ